MQPGQDPTENDSPASVRRRQFIEYLQQQQLILQQREQHTSNLLDLLSQTDPPETTGWNPLLNIPSDLTELPATSTSLPQTGTLPEANWPAEQQDQYNLRFEEDEEDDDEQLIDDDKDEEVVPSGSEPKPSLDDMSSTSDFVKKLYRMLEDPRFQSVVCWGPLGDCFIVKDIQECTKSILPRVFKHSNFSSFVRQLNKYGFRKLKSTDGSQSWVFQHADFRSGDLGALERIKRKPSALRKRTADSMPAPAVPGVDPSTSGSSSPSTTSRSTLEVNRPFLRRGLSVPQVQPAHTGTARSVAGVDQELSERLSALERNHVGLLEEMINFQQGLSERNEFIQNLIARSFQGAIGNTDPVVDHFMSNLESDSRSNLQAFRSPPVGLDPERVPVPTVQQPGSSSESLFSFADPGFRLIQPSFNPGNMASVSGRTSVSQSTAMATQTRSRNIRRFSANDAEALSSSLLGQYNVQDDEDTEVDVEPPFN